MKDDGIERKKGKRKGKQEKVEGSKEMNREKMRQISTKAVGDEGDLLTGTRALWEFQAGCPSLGLVQNLARAQHEYLSPLHPCPHTSVPTEHTQRC